MFVSFLFILNVIMFWILTPRRHFLCLRMLLWIKLISFSLLVQCNCCQGTSKSGLTGPAKQARTVVKTCSLMIAVLVFLGEGVVLVVFAQWVLFRFSVMLV